MPSAEPELTGTTKVAEKGNKMLEWLKTILGELCGLTWNMSTIMNIYTYASHIADVAAADIICLAQKRRA